VSAVTPAQVEAELARLSEKLEEKSDKLATLLESAATADVNYKLGHARQLLRAEGDTVSEREAEAVLACADLLRERRHSEALADAAKESIRSLRTQLDALRSINANVRYSAGLELG
jgi:hypothetical protein